MMLSKAFFGFILLITPFLDVLEQWVRICSGLLGFILVIVLIRQGIITIKLRNEQLKIRKLERKMAERKALTTEGTENTEE